MTTMTIQKSTMNQGNIKKNTIYNAIKTLASIIFPLITFPYINRTLLPDNVGKINFGLSIISYFSLIASLGITTYAIRECSGIRDDKEKLSNTASQIFSINIITTIIAYALLAATLIFYHKLEQYRVLIVIQSLTIVATTLGADWLNSAMEDFRYITIRTVAFQLASLVLMFIFIHRPEDYMKYAVISLVSSAGANIINIWYRRKYCDTRFIRNIRSGIEWKRHLTPILLLFVMILAQNIYSNVDTTMLGLMYGDREVGIYTTARKVAMLLFQVIVSIAWVVMPRMAYYFKENKTEEANTLLRKVFGFYLLIGLPCLVGVGLLSKDIILLFAGSEYTGADSVLQIIIIGFLFDLFGASLMGNIVFLPSGKEKIYMIICGITAIINLAANYIIIPVYGASGAAMTTAFCNLIMFILFYVLRDKRVKLTNIGKLVYTPLLGCVMLALVCWALSGIASLWIRVILSVSLSLIMYVLIQWVGKNELFIEAAGKVITIIHQRLGR